MLTLRARYVVPVASAPIRDGQLTIDAGRIVALGASAAAPRPSAHDVLDLGDVAILPGLVNAHVHLEFSALAQPLGSTGGEFTAWVRQLMQYRRSAAPPLGESLSAGLEESQRAGVTTLGEIAQPGFPVEAFTPSGPHAVIFQELIAPTNARLPAAVEQARAHLAALPGDGRWSPGLSPHAPNTVRLELLEAAISLSAAARVPLAFHLAESRAELELLQTGGGPLRQMLEEFGAWEPGLVRPGSRPLDYLRRLTAAHRALVIHGNYLDAEEIALAARERARMSIVYCPRTHAHFAHPRYPLEAMLAAGVRVALGTDGRGSTPDLNLLADLRYVARAFPSLGAAELVRMATLSGAEALGREADVGSLEPGKWADLALLRLPTPAADPYEVLLHADEPIVGTWRQGVKVGCAHCSLQKDGV